MGAVERRVYRSCQTAQRNDGAGRLAEQITGERATSHVALRGDDVLAMPYVGALSHVFHVHPMGLLAFGHCDDAIRGPRQQLVVPMQIFWRGERALVQRGDLLVCDYRLRGRLSSRLGSRQFGPLQWALTRRHWRRVL